MRPDSGQRPSQRMKRLKSFLTIKREKQEPNLYRLEASHPNTVYSMALLSSWMEALEKHTSDRFSSKDEVRELSKKYTEIRKELDVLKQEVVRASANRIEVRSRINKLGQQKKNFDKISGMIRSVIQKKQVDQAWLDKTEKLLSTHSDPSFVDFDFPSESFIRNNPSATPNQDKINESMNRLFLAKSQLAEAKAKYGDGHPEVQSLKRQVQLMEAILSKQKDSPLGTKKQTDKKQSRKGNAKQTADQTSKQQIAKIEALLNKKYKLIEVAEKEIQDEKNKSQQIKKSLDEKYRKLQSIMKQREVLVRAGMFTPRIFVVEAPVTSKETDQEEWKKYRNLQKSHPNLPALRLKRKR